VTNVRAVAGIGQLVPAGGYVYAGGSAVIRRFDLATGRVRVMARGAVWNPATGTVRVIATGGGTVLGAATAPGARHSLLAWQPVACELRNCPVEITDTSSLRTVTARSPLRAGFTTSGAAFSPDGTRLAVFARTAPVSGPAARARPPLSR
jgi:hypothetical protein